MAGPEIVSRSVICISHDFEFARIEPLIGEQPMRKTGVVMGVTCLASLLLLFVEPAEALDCTTEPDRPGCESATKVIRDLREKYGSLDDTIGCVTVAVVSEGAIPPNHCLRVVRFARNVRQEMIRFWNAQANGGWATIGPRPLEFNGSFDGRIVSRGTRMFITQVSVDENQVEILITKRGGRNPTNVTICLFDPEEGGRNTLVHSFQIPAGKGNRGRTWTYVVDDTFGRFMSVLLTGLAVDPRTLDYTLEARTSGGAPQVELAASAPETDPRPESSSAGDPFPAEPSAPEVLFGEKFREMTAAGYRLVDVEAYPVGPQTRYTGIWVKDGRTP
jgi:hypothetical protein